MYILQTVVATESACCHKRALLHSGIHGLVGGWVVTDMQRGVCCEDGMSSRVPKLRYPSSVCLAFLMKAACFLAPARGQQ